MPELPELMTPSEVAAYLGVTTATLAQWRSAKKELPHTKAGGSVRYLRSDVTEYLASRRQAVAS